MRSLTSRSFVRLLCAVVCLFTFLVPASRPAFAAATVTVVNLDGPNEGFNDPTPPHRSAETPIRPRVNSA